MSVLKSLQLTALQKTSRNPVLDRRAKLIARLEEQKALAGNPAYVRTSQRWVKVDGERQPVAKHQRVRPWWRAEITGQTVISLFYGTKPLEIERGKPAVIVPSIEALVDVIDTLIKAVRQGELDEVLGQQGKARATPKTKRAA